MAVGWRMVVRAHPFRLQAATILILRCERERASKDALRSCNASLARALRDFPQNGTPDASSSLTLSVSPRAIRPPCATAA
jgi:hypothetical protein